MKYMSCESYPGVLVVGSCGMSSNWQPGGSTRAINIPGFHFQEEEVGLEGIRASGKQTA